MSIKSWSHSKLGDFEACKRRAYLKHVARVPDPERPLPPGKTEHANDRGSRVHDALELYVSGRSDYLPYEAEKHFGIHIDMLRVFHDEGMVSLEGEWGMDQDWEIADWRTAWLRLKLDVCVHLDPTHAVVIDYKTGKKFGNEIKHGEQLQLYQLVTLLRHPELEKVTAELWYLDTGDVTSTTFTRAQGLRFKAGMHKRGLALTSCEVFPPNPNKFSCRWCPYLYTEHCEVGVRF